MERNKNFSKLLLFGVAISIAALMPLPGMAANKLLVNGTDGVTNKFVVTDQGFVGIGTNNPLKPIDVAGPSVVTSQISSRLAADTASGGGGFITYHNRATLGANGGLPQSGDRLGYFLFGSISTIVDAGGNLMVLNAAGISAYAGDTFTFDGTTRYMPSYFEFETASATSTNSRVERLRIGSESISGTATIGVNTTTPKATFDVNGSLRINPGNTLPANGVAVTKPGCSDSNRGAFWFTQGAGNAKDLLEICASDGTGANWRTIY